jgi:hypothetical protein
MENGGAFVEAASLLSLTLDFALSQPNQPHQRAGGVTYVSENNRLSLGSDHDCYAAEN